MGTSVPVVRLPSGVPVPALGLGTRGMAEVPARREAEIRSLRAGLDVGLSLIDTSEEYAFGGAESLVGEAVAGRRDEVFLVTKVLPHNAGRSAAIAACERSLRRLGTDRLDLYLLYGRGRVPLVETVAAFTTLRDHGKIRHWGVVDFDLPDVLELVDQPEGWRVAADQVWYNPARRGIEADLLPRCQSGGLPILAYGPFERGRLLRDDVVNAVARRQGVSPARIVLAWILRQPAVCTVAKAGSPEHVRDNRGALDVQLSEEDLRELDGAFPAPTAPVPLEVG